VYRLLVNKMNKDAVNLILRYLFSPLKRVAIVGVEPDITGRICQTKRIYVKEMVGESLIEGPEKVIVNGDILSEEDLDLFLRYELYD
jgi:hypothetical protein